jgi:hypothetical protein
MIYVWLMSTCNINKCGALGVIFIHLNLERRVFGPAPLTRQCAVDQSDQHLHAEKTLQQLLIVLFLLPPSHCQGWRRLWLQLGSKLVQRSFSLQEVCGRIFHNATVQTYFKKFFCLSSIDFIRYSTEIQSMSRERRCAMCQAWCMNLPKHKWHKNPKKS